MNKKDSESILVQSNKYSNLSDADLVKVLILDADNQEAFRALYLRTHRILYNWILVDWGYQQQDDLNDLVQEIYVRVHDQLRRNYVEYNAFFAWFKKLARNYFLNHCRNLSSKKMMREEREIEQVAYIDDSDDDLERKKLIEIVMKVLQEAPKTDRDYITQYFLGERTYKELADDYNCGFFAMVKRVTRSVERLKVLLCESNLVDKSYFSQKFISEVKQRGEREMRREENRVKNEERQLRREKRLERKRLRNNLSPNIGIATLNMS